jgi:hypothetical protein
MGGMKAAGTAGRIACLATSHVTGRCQDAETLAERIATENVRRGYRAVG